MPARRVISTVVRDPNPSPRTISMTASISRWRVDGVPGAFRSTRTFAVGLFDMSVNPYTRLVRAIASPPVVRNEEEVEGREGAEVGTFAREGDAVGPDRRVRD